jgi:hypothetical protein
MNYADMRKAGLGQSHEVCEFMDASSKLYNDENEDIRPWERNLPVVGIVAALPRRGLKKGFGLVKSMVSGVGNMASRTFGGKRRQVLNAPTTMKFLKRRNKEGTADPFQRFLSATDASHLTTTTPAMPAPIDAEAANAQHVPDYGFAELFVSLSTEIFGLRDTAVYTSSLRTLLVNLFGGCMDQFARQELDCTVRVFRQIYTLEDAIGSPRMFARSEHACDQWHSSRKFTLLPVDTVNCVATLKVYRSSPCILSLH